MNFHNQRKIERLQAGETIISREKGNSMSRTIKSGQPVRIAPIKSLDDIQVGDIVFARFGHQCYTHKVWAKGDKGCLIGNQTKPSNGWTTNVYGKVVDVLPMNT